MKYPNLTSATIIEDSVTKRGHRMTTVKMVFPRYILAELNTHRVFGRNSASSRAIPFGKMVKSAMEIPFIPMAWQTHHKGMQGSDYLTSDIDIAMAHDMWLEARDKAVQSAKNLFTLGGDNGVTKQLCNRILEPFIYHTALVTSTEWENFFELRCPKYDLSERDNHSYRSKKDYERDYGTTNLSDLEWLQYNKGMGEIHIMDLAEKIWDAMNDSTPEVLEDGEWHIPFSDFDLDKLVGINPDIRAVATYAELQDIKVQRKWLITDMIRIATARAARISYESLGDNPVIDYEKDIKLHDQLLVDRHMSPFEHIGRAMTNKEYISHVRTSDLKGEWSGTGIHSNTGVYKNIIHLNTVTIPEEDHGWSRNLHGFVQYREIVESNNN